MTVPPRDSLILALAYTVVKALTDPGPYPAMHWATRDRHRREWPALHRTLDRMADVARGEPAATGGRDSADLIARILADPLLPYVQAHPHVSWYVREGRIVVDDPGNPVTGDRECPA